MREIGPGLLERCDRIALCHRASAEASELGKDEPHPVGALGAAPDFAERARIDRLLRLDEPLKRWVRCHFYVPRVLSRQRFWPTPAPAAGLALREIGRASGRERVCQYV